MANNYTPPSALGQGVNTFLNEGVSTALQIVGSSMVNSSETSTVTVCTTVTELFEALNVSLSLNVIEPGWSADAKAQLVQDTNITSTSVTIAIYATTAPGTHSVTQSRLLSGLPTDPERFFASYGDSFVSSISVGAEYIALYTFYTQTVQQQTALAGEIRARNLSVNGSLQASLNSITSSATVGWTFNQKINGMSGVQLPSEDGVASFAQRFPTLPVRSGTILSYTTSGYETVPNPPWPPTSVIVGNRNVFLGVPGLVAGFETQIADLILLDNTFTHLKNLYTKYRYTDPTITGPLSTLKANLQAAANYLISTNPLSPGVGVNPTIAVVTPPPLGILEIHDSRPVPVPNFAVRPHPFPQNMGEIGQPSGFGGDINQSWVDEMTLPSMISLFQDALGCTGISIIYSTADGATITETGGSGNPGQTLQLGPGEVIASVAGSASMDAFGHLAITTSHGNSITSGTLGGTPFSWSFGNDAAFLGFSGTTGRTIPIPGLNPFIVELVVNFVAFAPADWQPLLSQGVAMARPDRKAKAA